MTSFWKWIERIPWILAIILFGISILKEWWSLKDIQLLWNNLTPGRLMAYLIIGLILIAILIRIIRISHAFNKVSNSFLLRKPFIAKLGVYWDKQKTPYCPNCQIILSGGQYSNTLFCSRCKTEFNLRHGSILYSLEDAVTAIKDGIV